MSHSKSRVGVGVGVSQKTRTPHACHFFAQNTADLISVIESHMTMQVYTDKTHLYGNRTADVGRLLLTLTYLRPRSPSAWKRRLTGWDPTAFSL